jgi:hypothetical protein
VSIKNDAPFLPHIAKAVDEVPEELEVGVERDPPPVGEDVLPPLDEPSGLTGVLGAAGAVSAGALGGVLGGIAGDASGGVPGVAAGGTSGEALGGVPDGVIGALCETGAGLSFWA